MYASPGTDGKAKMSKSLGNCIYLADEPEVIRKKVMSMYTDPDHIRIEDPGKLDGNCVFIYLDAFCNDDYFAEYLPEYQNLQELKDHYTRGGLGDVKVKEIPLQCIDGKPFPDPGKKKRTGKRYSGDHGNSASGKHPCQGSSRSDIG